MTMRNVVRAGVVAGAIAVWLSVGVAGQSKPTPKTPWGHPDLQGLWNVATLTPLERPDEAKGKLTFSESEVRKLEGANSARRELRARPSNGDRQAPPVGGDGSTGAAGNVGGYNNFWVDPGDTYNKVDGQYRTSMIVDPADGRIPPTLPEALKRNAARVRATPTSDAPDDRKPEEDVAKAAEIIEAIIGQPLATPPQ